MRQVLERAVYYFTGTGNSLVVARDIADRIGASLFPIASFKDEKDISVEAESIGIVFPVYFMGLPNIVKSFCSKLGGIGDKYIFAVCTYGGGKGDSIKELRSVLSSAGGRLSAVIGVHMPQNSFKKPGENSTRVLKKWKALSLDIADRISQKKEFYFVSNRLIDLVQIPLTPLLRPAYMKYMIEETGGSKEQSREELIGRIDMVFETNQSCNGCGSCARVCPVDNIEMISGRPVWLHKCEKCHACLNWCPNRAIYDRTGREQFFYRNPQVTFDDMLKQKQRNMIQRNNNQTAM